MIFGKLLIAKMKKEYFKNANDELCKNVYNNVNNFLDCAIINILVS